VKTEGDAVESAIKSTATDQVGDGAQGTIVEEGLETEEAEVQSEATLSEASESVGESTLAENPLETEQVEPQSASETSESIGESMPAPSHLSREDASAVTDDATPHHLPPFPPKETIYVGNLFFDVTASDLRTKFEQYGMVESTKIITDMRGLSKG
jgi:nucleolin